MDNGKSEEMKATAQFLVQTGRACAMAEEEAKVVTVLGTPYLFYRGEMKKMVPQDEPAPATFEAYTLQGLADYIHTDVDRQFDTCHIVRVSNATCVEVFAPVSGYKQERALIAKCTAKAPGIKFDTFMDGEDFMLMLMTRFHESDARNLLMKLSGNLREEQSMQTADDGFSQKVTIKKSVASVADVVVQNPVYLAPRRTFNEIEAPVSPFVVRFKDGGQVALFEADGGAWKDEAVKKIGAWLDAAMADCNVEVIA